MENSRLVFFSFGFFFSPPSFAASPSPPSGALDSAPPSSAGLSSSTISSTICAELSVSDPLISCLTFTLILQSASAGELMLKVAMALLEPAGNPFPSALSSYMASTVNFPDLRSVTRLTMGKLHPRSNMTTELVGVASPASASTSIPASCAPSHSILMGKGWYSTTSYGRTLKRGERMADWSAQPLATASSAFIVVLSPLLTALASRPRTCASVSLTLDTRVAPPTISTLDRSAAVSLVSASARSMGPASLASSGSHMALYSSALRLMPKSRSSMRHSRLILASLTPAGLSVFLAFSAATPSLSMTLVLSLTAPLSLPRYFSSNLVAIQSDMTASKSRPPRSTSYCALLTTSRPGWKSTMLTL
mmetsp:Transcript_36822/g.88042  ORF Transcript_36822/g.88042 Transcript_36822/m.88042 type:complete len:363 (-) Transcript_36822:801-1889(-)